MIPRHCNHPVNLQFVTRRLSCSVKTTSNQQKRPICGLLRVYATRYTLRPPNPHLTEVLIQVLSGKIPFYQIASDIRVLGAIANGGKPKRPDQGGAGGNEISDAMWELLLVCWERAPGDRP